MREIYNISRNIQETTAINALDGLSNLASTEYTSILYNTLKLDATINEFINGKLVLCEVKEASELLLNSVYDATVLICEATGSKIKRDNDDNYIIEIDKSYVNNAYKFVDTINRWLRNHISDTNLVSEAKELLELCDDICYTISILENRVGSNYIAKQTSDEPYNSFNSLLVETVSTGAIAIKPAALMNNTKSSNKKQSNKKRWYLQYYVSNS
jgi:hypothetical protein